MEVLELLVFASLILVISALVFFAWNVLVRSHDYSERLALLPLDDEGAAQAATRHSHQGVRS